MLMAPSATEDELIVQQLMHPDADVDAVLAGVHEAHDADIQRILGLPLARREQVAVESPAFGDEPENGEQVRTKRTSPVASPPQQLHSERGDSRRLCAPTLDDSDEDLKMPFRDGGGSRDHQGHNDDLVYLLKPFSSGRTESRDNSVIVMSSEDGRRSQSQRSSQIAEETDRKLPTEPTETITKLTSASRVSPAVTPSRSAQHDDGISILTSGVANHQQRGQNQHQAAIMNVSIRNQRRQVNLKKNYEQLIQQSNTHQSASETSSFAPPHHAAHHVSMCDESAVHALVVAGLSSRDRLHLLSLNQTSAMGPSSSETIQQHNDPFVLYAPYAYATPAEDEAFPNSALLAPVPQRRGSHRQHQVPAMTLSPRSSAAGGVPGAIGHKKVNSGISSSTPFDASDGAHSGSSVEDDAVGMTLAELPAFQHRSGNTEAEPLTDDEEGISLPPPQVVIEREQHRRTNSQSLSQSQGAKFRNSLLVVQTAARPGAGQQKSSGDTTALIPPALAARQQLLHDANAQWLSSHLRSDTADSGVAGDFLESASFGQPSDNSGSVQIGSPQQQQQQQHASPYINGNRGNGPAERRPPLSIVRKNAQTDEKSPLQALKNQPGTPEFVSRTKHRHASSAEPSPRGPQGKINLSDAQSQKQTQPKGKANVLPSAQHRQQQRQGSEHSRSTSTTVSSSPSSSDYSYSYSYSSSYSDDDDDDDDDPSETGPVHSKRRQKGSEPSPTPASVPTAAAAATTKSNAANDFPQQQQSPPPPPASWQPKRAATAGVLKGYRNGMHESMDAGGNGRVVALGSSSRGPNVGNPPPAQGKSLSSQQLSRTTAAAQRKASNRFVVLPHRGGGQALSRSSSAVAGSASTRAPSPLSQSARNSSKQLVSQSPATDQFVPPPPLPQRQLVWESSGHVGVNRFTPPQETTTSTTASPSLAHAGSSSNSGRFGVPPPPESRPQPVVFRNSSSASVTPPVSKPVPSSAPPPSTPVVASSPVVIAIPHFNKERRSPSSSSNNNNNSVIPVTHVAAEYHGRHAEFAAASIRSGSANNTIPPRRFVVGAA